ncbi:MAG: hypothetical protein AVDCRST_MAG68-3786, partial [uncultured Gemmatimonadetes bacterium]
GSRPAAARRGVRERHGPLTLREAPPRRRRPDGLRHRRPAASAPRHHHGSL